MIYTKDHKTHNFFDPWERLGPKRRKMLSSSWAGLFREEILPILPVAEVSSSFSCNDGRSTKELYSALGVVVLQQILDKTDSETVSAFSFDMQWHYALNITEEDDSASYLCEKSLWNYRDLLARHQLDQVLFEKVVERFSSLFSVNTDRQRIDSVHIQSNMCFLGRIGIFAKAINRFLVNLKRHHREEYNRVPPEVIKSYGSKKSVGVFSLVKPSESGKTLASSAETLFDLVQFFADNESVKQMSSYHLLVRVLGEQCTLSTSTDSGQSLVELKSSGDVPSDSLQNPSDIDATYDGHKGQGYQAQVMETWSEKEDAKSLNLITYVHVEQAHKSDANALLPALESTKGRRCSPGVLLADSLYGGDENSQAAKVEGVELIAPVMGRGKGEKIGLEDFSFTDDGEVMTCPAGKMPVEQDSNEKRTMAYFLPETCSACPFLQKCRIKAGKKMNVLRYTKKEVRLALRRMREGSSEFLEKYRYRSGIEATNSELQRKTGIKRMRVRGLKMMTFCFTLKALGINLFRANNVRVNAETLRIMTTIRKSIGFMGNILGNQKSYQYFTGVVLISSQIRANI